MVTQSQLAEKFKNGAKSGQASNVHIQEGSHGGTVLVGYNHAVYAHRAANGTITVYMGWTYSNNPIRPKAGSVSTKQQYSRMGLEDMADRVVKSLDPKGAPKSYKYLGDRADPEAV